MTRELLRHRIETKLLAQAAANKVAGRPTSRTRRSRRSYEKDKATTYALPERRKVRHILVKDKALADQLYAQLESSDANFAELAKQYSTDTARKTNGGELGEVVNRTNLVKPFADVAFTTRPGRRLAAGQDAVRLAPDRGRGAGPAREHASARRDAASCRSAPSSSEEERQKTHREAVRTAEIELSRDIQFAPGYGPPIASTQ